MTIRWWLVDSDGMHRAHECEWFQHMGRVYSCLLHAVKNKDEFSDDYTPRRAVFPGWQELYISCTKPLWLDCT